ncbi:CGNR zinc finger domain-containing protein [Nakamurella panacisegetis]|uniref:CGNR zinc finger domain-containing protein n=1 Tax=Nakamurella panacisegetis TaxID=1090615 RepID=UPI0012FE171C
MFVDTSQAGTRRCCGMIECGSNAKGRSLPSPAPCHNGSSRSASGETLVRRFCIDISPTSAAQVHYGISTESLGD